MNPVNPELAKPESLSPPLADVIALDGRPMALDLTTESTPEEIEGLLDAVLSQLGRAKISGSPEIATNGMADRAPALAQEEQTLRGRTRKERNQPISQLISNRRRQLQCSAEETILELYHANLSMHQLENLVDQLWGTRLSLAIIGRLHRKIVRQLESWRERPIKKTYPYVFLAGIELKCSCGYEKKEASVLMAMGIDENGEREVLGVAEGGKETNASWQEFLHDLKERGLCGVRLFIGDRGPELTERMALIFPGMHFQSSVVQFHRKILSLIPVHQLLAVESMLRSIDASEDWHTARGRVTEAVAELKKMNLLQVAEIFEKDIWDTLNYLVFPLEHRRGLRSNSPQMKILRNISERTRMVGGFSDGASAVHLVSARLRHIETTIWNKKRYPWGRL